MRHPRRALWIGALLVLTTAGSISGLVGWKHAAPQPIRVGILHSLSGPMAPNETPLVEALQLAIAEINESGGLLGRRIEAVVADCRSDAGFCGQEAERLISQEKVRALFGCWTSACRKQVKAVVERHHHLLFYSLQYEGMESSSHIIYLGAAPNQQLIPAVRWALDNLGKRFYLIGSDYVFPRTANLVMKDIISAQGGEVVAERYVPPGDIDAARVAGVIAELRRLKPAVVINTINGSANVAFFTALAEAGLTAEGMPVISTSVAENGLHLMAHRAMVGHYAVWSYFQSLPGDANQRFVAAFRRRYGAQRVTNDPMEISYIGVKLWSQAVQEIGTDDPTRIGVAILKQSIAAPEGIVSLNPDNRHAWRNAHVGRARADGQFDIVWSSASPIRPEPYPTYRTVADWEVLLQKAGLQ